MAKIKRLSEYVIEVERIMDSWGGLSKTIHPWFRGQARDHWDLIPNLYRGIIDPTYERELLRDFKLRAIPFVKSIPGSEMEWLFLMQHFGMPTRLLDWTESHLAALYFAVKQYDDKEDAAVWVLDPWAFNIATIRQQSVPTIDHPALQKYVIPVDPEKILRKVEAGPPAAIRPSRGNHRIVAQRGTFTIHGNVHNSINKLVEAINNKSRIGQEIKLYKLVIEGTTKKKIFQDLYWAGITHSILFPDLGSLGQEITERYCKKFMC